MELTDRLIQIEQMAAVLQNEAAKVRKELEKGKKKKPGKYDHIQEMVNQRMAEKRKNYKVIYK